MALASLLVYDGSPTFQFEHAMAHRHLLCALNPLDRFSVVPYLLDPAANVEPPATAWHLNHQQAHNDASQYLPSPYGGTEQYGIPLDQILIDSRLATPGNIAWWTFANHNEHLLAMNAVVLPTTVPVYPSW